MCDKKQISNKLKGEGRTITSWARVNGFKISTVHMALDGHLNPSAPRCKAIFAALEQGGYVQAEKDRPE